MKRNHHHGTGTLPLRPLKKQKLRTNEDYSPPTSSVHSTNGTHLATPLRGGESGNSINSHWVTPRVQQEPYRNHNPDTEFGSLATPKSNEVSTYQVKDNPNKVSPIPEQKENLPHRLPSSRGVSSSKEKNRKELKAILHRNGQNITGTVKVLQNRVADGEARGKLGICPRCGGGKLKIEDQNPHLVYCSRKLLCGFQCHTLAAPRAGPWTCVSFDDDQDDSATTTDSAAAANTSSSSGSRSSSSPGNTPAPSTVGHTPDKKIAMRPRYQMPSPHGMYHCYPGFSSPPPPYWNSQRSPPPPPQQCARYQGGPYTYYYPPPMGFPQHPQHHPRQPLYPLQTGYPPMSPHHGAGPPNVYQHPENVPYNGEQRQHGENVARGRPWFPLSDPAYFPERGAAFPPRPLDEGERAGVDQDPNNNKNPGTCNHSPAEVAMATNAAKKEIGTTKHADGAKHVWTTEEDEMVRNAVTSSQSHHHFNAWSSLAPFLPNRTGKQIRDRWINHLNPHLIHTPFERDEDLLLWNAFLKFGKSWKEISIRHFHSRRSENKIKNRWHSSSFQKFIAETVGTKEYERAISRSELG